MFNWEGIASNPDALAALRAVLSQAPPCLVRRLYSPNYCWFGALNDFFLRQVQPAHYVTFCDDMRGAAVVSFMTCQAARNASVELRVAGERIGDKVFVSFAPSSGADNLMRHVALPMFKDATSAAAADAAGVVVIITTSGCEGSQNMRATIDMRQAVFNC